MIFQRIIVATFKANPTVSFFVTYGTSECSDNKEKETFYTSLNNIIQNIPEHNMIILLIFNEIFTPDLEKRALKEKLILLVNVYIIKRQIDTIRDC